MNVKTLGGNNPNCHGSHLEKDLVGLPSEGQSLQESSQLPDDGWLTDPRNPVNWSSARKWTIVTLLWATITMASICSVAFEPAIPSMLKDFGTTSHALSGFIVSVYTIGYCIGPLITSPASELYGRVRVIYPSFVLYLICLAVCSASSNVALFIVFQGLMGCAGITFIISGGAIVADIIPKHRRGLAQSFLTSGTTLGPTTGPIIGGLIAENIGWRWIFWIEMIAAIFLFWLGTILAVFVPILRETYPPILLARRQKTNKRASRPSEVFRNASLRPLRFLFRTRLVPMLAFFTSIINSYLLILFATLGTTFQSEYRFSPFASGLAYLGLLVGFVLSEIGIGLFSDSFLKRRTDPIPEHRLPLLIVGASLLPGVLLMYGWTIHAHTHWMVPIVASGLIAAASMCSYIPVQVYFVDVYTLHAASAIGAASIVRSVLSSIVPLGADPLYSRLGYGWGFTLLAGIALLFVFGALYLVKWGERIRHLDGEMK